MEVLCSILHFPDLPEQILPKLCSSVLAPSSELSYSTATVLTKSLLLKKVHHWEWCKMCCCVLYWQSNVLLCWQVLSLSEPASRCLVTAVTSLCSRCPRPVCHALIGPVLEDKNIGEEMELQSQQCIMGDCRAAIHLRAYIPCPGSSLMFWGTEQWLSALFTSHITWLFLFSGNPQAELLNRLIEGCLDSHYRLLVLE